MAFYQIVVTNPQGVEIDRSPAEETKDDAEARWFLEYELGMQSLILATVLEETDPTQILVRELAVAADRVRNEQLTSVTFTGPRGTETYTLEEISA